MPPKSARGRKKAVTSEVVQNGSESKVECEEVITNGQNLNHDNFYKLNKKTENTNIDMLSENGNGHLQNVIESSETVENLDNNSDESNGEYISNTDKLIETKSSKKITKNNVENVTNSNIAPLKHDKKKANVPAENVKVLTETADLVPVDDENKKEPLPKESHNDMITESPKSHTPADDRSEDSKPKSDTDDKNKQKNKKAPLRRGRPKKTTEETSAKQLQTDKKVVALKSDKISDLKRIEENNEDTSEQIFHEQDAKQIPSKRGRKKANPLKPDQLTDVKKCEEVNEEKSSEVIDNEQQTEEKDPVKQGLKKADTLKSDAKKFKEPAEEIFNERLQTEEQVPSKRGRKRAIPLKSDQLSDVKIFEEVNEEKSSEKILNEQQAKEKVPVKRGRKKAETLKSDESSGVKKFKKEPAEEIINQQLEEQVPSKRGRKKANPFNSDVKKFEVIVEEPSEEIFNERPQTDKQVISKRGRKKANIPLKSDKSNLKKIEKDVNEEDSSSVTNELNSDVFKKPNIPSQCSSEKTKEHLSVVHKRKNEASVEETDKNKQCFNESKVLVVVLERKVSIDKMCEEQTKITKKGRAENTKAGGKRAREDLNSKESGEKSPKMPKGETKSKGQSRKDKMPNVALLDFGNDSVSPSGKPWNLKISSWNVNGVRAWIEKDGLAYVTHENPDIVAFQETKCSDKMLPKDVNIVGYHSYWLAGDKDGYSGVGLLSKKEPLSVNYGIGIEEHDKEGRVITAEYETFYLVTAYVPNAGRGLVRLEYRMQWDEDFRSYLKNLDEKKPVILCGDLNVAHEEIDLANPKTNKKNAGFTKEEREGFSTILSEGFIDSFRHLYPDEKGAYTFWTYMMNSRAKNVGWRLDYFVLSKKLTEHLCDNVIRKDVFGSDHCPITLFLCI